ncbi:hypothetical protein AK812_SmicGene44783 [Symbiodinium microadriaticum]|uniref:Uncharacterized protein n=1 Tax=Symbiodinium microadriaticum TaxID=2951 RepID=A0A1Q9BXK8_SYMMI|nr:hypothetical protein AK812_SmicGene44783 [Symbiodinium microadriaticum]
MPNIHLKHEAEMRGKRDDLVHTKPEQPSDGTAGKDIVESVASGDGGLFATEEVALRLGGNVGAGELVEVDVPVSSRDPIGDVLDKGEELCQDGGVGLRVQARARLQVYRDDNKSPLGVLERHKPSFGAVCGRERFGLARRLGFDGNVGEGGQGREFERPCGARAVLKDLPNELAFQCFFRQPLVLDPVCTGYGCTMQIGIVGQLAPKKGGKVAQLGDAFSSRAVSALSSMSSGTGSPCHCARSLLWPVVSGWGSHAALTFKGVALLPYQQRFVERNGAATRSEGLVLVGLDRSAEAGQGRAKGRDEKGHQGDLQVLKRLLAKGTRNEISVCKAL